MKVAEALIERADLQRSMTEIQKRLKLNAQYQEGTQPTESAEDLLKLYKEKSAALEKIIVAINQRNQQLSLANGMPMVAALAKRERLLRDHSTLVTLANDAVPHSHRYSNTEIISVSAVDIAALRKLADQLAKEARELDVLIQASNWQYDL